MYRWVDYSKKQERSVMRILFFSGFFSIVLLVSINAQSAQLGRLFFTPEQRAQLDYDYQRQGMPESSSNSVILNGIVQEHGGKRTAWINGIAQEAGNSDERSPESMPVSIPGKDGRVKIKVGQKLMAAPIAPQE